MAQENELQQAKFLLVGQDMDWMHAFRKGISRFFTVEEKRAEMIEDIEGVLKSFSPNFVAITVEPSLTITVERLIRLLPREEQIPIIAITQDSWTGNNDELIKQGANFVLNRKHLLSAIRAVQQIMTPVKQAEQLSTLEANYKNIAQRYDRLFLDVPDPVCYLQDGLFLNANPAFHKAFKLPNAEHLEEVTIMQFVPIKTEKPLKEMMKLAKDKDIVPAATLEFIDYEQGKLEFTTYVHKVIYDGNPALEMYLRDQSAGGSGGGVDPSTGLPSPSVLRASIRQNQERAESDFLGCFVYLWAENYREVLQKDGFKAAEILITAVADTAQRLLPASTEMARITDDALIIWLAGDKEQAISRIKGIVSNLDELVPENIGRLIHPQTYAGMVELRRNSTYDQLISNSYRATRQLVLSQSGERIAEPTATNMTRKEERTVAFLNKLIDTDRIKYQYQPIACLEPTEIERYQTAINILPNPNPQEEEEEIELDVLLQYANRFQLARKMERQKIAQFCSDLLSYTGDQSKVQIHLPLAYDALDDETFPEWLESQLVGTGVSPTQVVLDISLDAANETFSGAKALIDRMRPLGAKLAISAVGIYDENVEEIFNRVKPNVLKLDMNEIDTLEDQEEFQFMSKIKEYAEEHDIELIVANMDSPAQLSHVFPYELQLVQGDGLVPPMDNFEFDFSEPLF
ncbi:MAG: EAL domain-containing protein [Cardiobacteriaceae bacterium]|nr:EAL domain-containing protein [Cardiobacteriaceae bacterium]